MEEKEEIKEIHVQSLPFMQLEYLESVKNVREFFDYSGIRFVDAERKPDHFMGDPLGYIKMDEMGLLPQ